MKTGFAILVSCALLLSGCQEPQTAATDTLATDTVIPSSAAMPSAVAADPIELARKQIDEAKIKERDALRTELASRTASDAGLEREWKEFRRAFPYHIQEIAVAQRQGNERTVIIAEPPPFVSLDDILDAAGPALVSYAVQKNPIGFDGWVKDVVLRISGDEAAVSDAISRLSYTMFRTTYKAHVLPLPTQPNRRRLDLDLDVTPAEIEQWLMNDRERFVPVLGGTPLGIEELFQTSTSRVFFSGDHGLVVWWIPAETRIDALPAEIRQFTLDSDLIIGAVHRSSGTLVIARERAVPVDDLPPLRFETIALLAGVDGEARSELQQSYERNAPFAGAIGKRWDWAPILLSPQLVDTEYGSLLNITDQLLKGWSNHGDTVYTQFERYPKPSSYPFRGPLPDVLLEAGGGELTYNWNTTGVGYSVAAESAEIYALYRTGALPVSYIPDGMKRTDPKVLNAEERGYEYFAGVRDPNLIRVVQYAALYQIFVAFDVRANAVSGNDRPHKLRETIESELNGELRAATDEQQEALARKLAEQVTRYAIERIGVSEDRVDFEAMTTAALPEVREDLQYARRGRHRPMSDTLSAFAELRNVPEKYKSAGDTSNVWIHTPLVVLSRNIGRAKSLGGGQYITPVGGHNLYAERTLFEASPDVPAGTARVTNEGLQVNPRDAGKARELLRVAARGRRANMTADEIAADVAATLRRIPEARPPRARRIALKLANNGMGGGRPPRPPYRGRGTNDHGAGNGWELFGGGGESERGLLPGAVYVERKKDRTIRIVFEGGEVRAATAEDATDAVTQLMKNGSLGEEGVRLELRGFEAGEDARNFVRSCNQRSGAADAEVSALVAHGRIDRAAAAEIRARQFDFRNAKVTQGDVVLVNGRPQSTIVIDLPRKDAPGSARTDLAIGFHEATPQPVARTLMGQLRALVDGLKTDPRATVDAIIFNMRINREIKAYSRRTGVPIEIVRQQFIDARGDLYFVELRLERIRDAS